MFPKSKAYVKKVVMVKPNEWIIIKYGYLLKNIIFWIWSVMVLKRDWLWTNLHWKILKTKTKSYSDEATEFQARKIFESALIIFVG